MKKLESKNKKNILQVIYIKPILTFDQVIEINDERIEILERVAKQMEDKKRKKDNKKREAEKPK